MWNKMHPHQLSYYLYQSLNICKNNKHPKNLFSCNSAMKCYEWTHGAISCYSSEPSSKSCDIRHHVLDSRGIVWCMFVVGCFPHQCSVSCGHRTVSSRQVLRWWSRAVPKLWPRLLPAQWGQLQLFAVWPWEDYTNYWSCIFRGKHKSQDSSVGTVSRLWDECSRVWLLAAKHPDQLWDPLSLLLNGYQGFLQGGKEAGWSWPFTSM